MKYTIMLGLVLAMFSVNGYAENRFSMELEYELMDTCVGGSQRYKTKAIKVCICTLQITMEDGFGPDYDNDEDFRENESKFMRNFRKNRIKCQSQTK